MLGFLLGAGPEIDLVIDIVLICVAAVLGGLLFWVKYEVGPFWTIARSKLFVIAVGKDRMARIIDAKTLAGQFLDLGFYGKAFADPSCIYRVFNSPKAQQVAVVYLPYAVTQDIEKMAAVSAASRGEAKIKVEKGEKGDPTYLVEIKEPTLVRVEEIEEWQKYSYNPILLKSAIEYARQETSEEQASAIRFLKVMMVVLLIMTVVGFVMSAVMK